MRSALAVAILKVADEVWIATALLHQEQPWRAGFRPSEILDRVARENLAGVLRPGVQVHISQHCVANRLPRPARYRMLYALPNGERRLFREDDDYRPERAGGKARPVKEDIPAQFHSLLDWYEQVYNGSSPVCQSLRGALQPRPSQPIRDWRAAGEAVERAIADEQAAG